MGRHSAEAQWPFYRSAVAWFLPWVALAGAVGVGIFLAVGALGRNELRTRPPAVTTEASTTPSASPAASPAARASARSGSGGSKDPGEEKSDAKKKFGRGKKSKASPLITQDMNVQVLNATRSPDADDRIADRLARLGFRIESLESSSRDYARTTVFWSYPSARTAARRLADRMGWIAAAKPDNLSPTVALHVVVGSDES